MGHKCLLRSRPLGLRMGRPWPFNIPRGKHMQHLFGYGNVFISICIVRGIYRIPSHLIPRVHYSGVVSGLISIRGHLPMGLKIYMPSGSRRKRCRIIFVQRLGVWLVLLKLSILADFVNLDFKIIL